MEKGWRVGPTGKPLCLLVSLPNWLLKVALAVERVRVKSLVPTGNPVSEATLSEPERRLSPVPRWAPRRHCSPAAGLAHHSLPPLFPTQVAAHRAAESVAWAVAAPSSLGESAPPPPFLMHRVCCDSRSQSPRWGAATGAPSLLSSAAPLATVQYRCALRPPPRRVSAWSRAR
jgi:hypothetical protein